jgi:P4 family phage/plasmid primase-like protien
MVNILKKQGDKIMKEASHKLYCHDFYKLLDGRKEILCFTNGVVDFNEKRFRQGVPEDYTHKHTRIPYIPIQDCDPVIIEEVNTFMNQLFPDKELCDYMWQHAASILIGGNQNQTFHIYIGDGRNGKSKFAELISDAIGEYRATVPISLITGKRSVVGGATPEVAALVGIRYAVAQESSIDDAINEGPLKELTGGDTIQCRALYSSAIEFIPMFKLVMSTNNLPKIKGKDDGTWRRVRACEFKSRFMETPDPTSKYQFPVDKNMDKKFSSWKTVFMSMLVELAYKTNGNIVDCSMVLRNSEKYRNDQDYLTSFVSARLMENVASVITDSQISAVFKDWWKEQYGNNPPMGKELFTYLTRLYADKANVVRTKTSWKGLCLVTDEEQMSGI